MEEFLQKKEAEVALRKQENSEKERGFREGIRKETEEAGWRKVAGNIRIKQGEQTSKKDINRMREAIIHKRDD